MNLRNFDKECVHGYKSEHRTVNNDLCHGGEIVLTIPGLITSHGNNNVRGHGVQGPWVHITVHEDLTIGDFVEVIVLDRDRS